ncbi:MAG: fructose-bisphosphatase class III [Candidatus Kaelpia imicola]|nr:fructose-bisphosphatase class III [Candidatus Kaelpia imicola]
MSKRGEGMVDNRKSLAAISYLVASLFVVFFQGSFNPSLEVTASVNFNLRRAHFSTAHTIASTVYVINGLETAEDVPASAFMQGPRGAEFAYVVQYDPVSKNLIVENIKLEDPHPFGFIFDVDDPSRAPPSGTLFVSDLHGTAIGPLGIIRSVPEDSEIIGAGDMLDRGPSVENSLSLLGDWTLGDHDIWAIGAALGNEHLLSLWLRMCYRNPPNERLLENLGIDLTEFKEFAKNTYEVLFSQALERGVILDKGPKKSVYEMAALNLHLKSSPNIQEEIRQIEEQAKEGNSKAQKKLKDLQQVLLPGVSGSLADLTVQERDILDGIKRQFLESEEVHNFISTLLRNAEIYREYDFNGKKVMVLHGIIPMEYPDDLAELGSYPSLTGRGLLDKMQERLKDLHVAYEEFKNTGDESILKPFIEELSFWGDNVNSPLFPRQETRLLHSYLDGTPESANPAYEILKDPRKAEVLLEALGEVDILILGHQSNKQGRVVDVSGDGNIFIIDGTFSGKGGEVGATETGAGLYIDEAGNVFSLHLLTAAEILAGKDDEYEEAKSIIREHINLSDLAYYKLDNIVLKDVNHFPIVKNDLENLCDQQGIDYDDILQKHGDENILSIIGSLLGVLQNSETKREVILKSIYEKLGSPYPTRFVFPAVVKTRSLNLADEGIEFNRTEQNLDDRTVEVAVLKIDLQEEIETVVVVDDANNNRLYANRLQNVVEVDGANSIAMNDMNVVRNGMQTIDEYIAEYESKHSDKEVIAALPASNVLWNDWFVAYSEGTLYHRFNEPIDNRSYSTGYSMFVVYNDGRVAIESLRFENNDQGLRVIKATSREDITDQINYATFGQQILRGGATRDITEISYQWDDLRHLIGFPEIRTLDSSLDYGGSYFLGKAELLQDRAQNGDLVDRALKGETITLNNVLTVLNADHFNSFGGELEVEVFKEYLKKSDYKEVDDPINVGEYCYDESTDTMKIIFKRAPFSHTAIGLTEEGDIVTVSVGALTQGGGATIEEVAEILRSQGAINGLLLCNGMDVAVNWQSERIFSAEEHLWGKRDRFSSVILFVKDK